VFGPCFHVAFMLPPGYAGSADGDLTLLVVLLVILYNILKKQQSLFGMGRKGWREF